MIINGNNLEPASINYSANYKKLVFNNFVYIPILKNAHRYTSTVLAAYDFDLDHNVSLENKTILVVLRDPIERWYAGIAQFLTWHTTHLTIDEEVMKLLTSVIVLDGHSRSQSNFLRGVNTDQCVFFNCDEENFSDKLHHYCRRNLGGVVDMSNLTFKAPYYNSTGEKYLNFKKNLKSMCSPIFLERLKKYYAEDYNLLETARFYRI